MKRSMSFWLLWKNLMLPVCCQTIVFSLFQHESTACLYFNISCFNISQGKNKLSFRGDKYSAHLPPLPSCSWFMSLIAHGTPAAPWCNCILQREESLLPLSALHHVRIQGKVSSLQCRGGVSPELDHADILNLGLSGHRTGRNEIMLFISQPACGLQ